MAISTLCTQPKPFCEADIAEGVRRFGTPCYLYDAAHIEARCAALKAALGQIRNTYSIKANPNLEICRLVRKYFEGAECASAGEIFLSEKAGFDLAQSVIAGPAKSIRDLEASVSDGLTINIESPTEFNRLSDLCGRLERRAKALLRVTSPAPFAAESQITMAGQSKFGVTEDEAAAQYRGLRSRHIEIRGIHCYNFSQVLQPEPIITAVKHTIKLARRLSSELDFELRTIDLGGGIGIAAEPGQKEFDLPRFAELLRQTLAGLDVSGLELLWEAGRYLVGDAGIFCTEILDVKQQSGRNFILTDGGMNAFLRPALQRRNHKCWILARDNEAPSAKYDIGGPICAPVDLIGRGVELPPAQVGDTLVVGSAGAYGYSMSPHLFLSHPAPPEAIWEDGEWRGIRARGAL